MTPPPKKESVPSRYRAAELDADFGAHALATLDVDPPAEARDRLVHLVHAETDAPGLGRGERAEQLALDEVPAHPQPGVLDLDEVGRPALAVPRDAMARFPAPGLSRPVSLVGRQATLGRPLVAAFREALIAEANTYGVRNRSSG